jgi:hypothetical protein
MVPANSCKKFGLSKAKSNVPGTLQLRYYFLRPGPKYNFLGHIKHYPRASLNITWDIFSHYILTSGTSFAKSWDKF